MAVPRCCNCVYSRCDPELWLRCLGAGEPPVLQCANHPWWPGQMHDVPGVACRHYRPKPPVPPGDVRWIPLSDGFYTSVDAADYEWLSQWHWHLSDGYATRREGGKTVYMHREIMKPPKGKVVDHRDGNKGNNCRYNLHVCTARENKRNLRKHHGACSRFKGVAYNRQRHKWFVRWGPRGGLWWVGVFEDEIAAARAYDYAAVAWSGASEGLNFPREWPPERRAQVYADARAEREAVLAKTAQAKRRRARKARAKRQGAKREKQKRSKTAVPRVKKPRGKERKRPAQDTKPTTEKRCAKNRRM